MVLKGWKPGLICDISAEQMCVLIAAIIKIVCR